MPETSTPGHSRSLTMAHKCSIAGVAALGAAALALSLVPAGNAGNSTGAAGAQTRAAQPFFADQQAKAAKKDRDDRKNAGGASDESPVHGNNLNGWIKESLGIMKEHGIPGTYKGLYKNIMRESSGDPSATNNWDINARNGDPSIGLLQVIRTTFLAYHVPGTAKSQYNPVANIVAAANYAAARYGSIDNVHSAY